MRRYGLWMVLLGMVLVSACGPSRKVRQARQAKIATVLQAAESYRGTPYRYGGLSHQGIDCSGLVYRSFQQAGMDLPRTSKEQLDVGKKVKLGKVKPGDLLFFATTKRRRKVSHSGIVTRVQGDQVYFIHASTSRGVMVSSLPDVYWSKKFRKARRPDY